MKLFGAVLTALIATTTVASAQTYPDRAIKVIVPFAAGGAVDSLARVIGAKMQESMKQPVVIENRPGAGGNLAAAEVARSAPDGYTILLTTVGHAMSPALYKKLSYDPVSGFTPVTQVISASLLLVTNPKFPAKDLGELLAVARSKPGALNYGSTGVGNPLHLTMEMLKSSAKVDIQMVPFRGDAPLNQALMQGEVEMAIVPLGTARPQVEAGTIRAIAVTGAARSKAMPDVKTVAEQGFPGFAMDSWQALFLPANAPRPIVERIHKEVAAALKDPEVIKRIEGFASEPVGSPPDVFAKFLASEFEKYRALINDLNIPAQD